MTTTDARHALGPQHALGEFAQLAPAFADQGDHHDIRRQPRARTWPAARTFRRRSRRKARSAGRAPAAAACRRPQPRSTSRSPSAPALRPQAARRRAGRARRGPRNSGRPSSGRPNGSTIRPIQLLSGAISAWPSKLDPVADRQAVARGHPGRTVAPARASGAAPRRPARRRGCRSAPGRPARAVRKPGHTQRAAPGFRPPAQCARTGAISAISASRPSKIPATGFSLCSLLTRF